MVTQGVVEADGSTCSGSEGLEDWEDGAFIEEVISSFMEFITPCRWTMQMNGQQKGFQE